MKKYFLFLTALFYSTVSFSALPPYYQSRAEIYALLSNEDVEKKLGPVSSITSISKVDNTYTIKTLSCTLKVKIRYIKKPSNKPGPATFQFQTSDYTCNEKQVD